MIRANFIFPSRDSSNLRQTPEFFIPNQLPDAVSACNIIDWIFWFFIVLAIIFTLIAAFRYLTAAGNPERVRSASVTLLYVVIAVLVALIAKGFPQIISSFIGGGLNGVGC